MKKFDIKRKLKCEDYKHCLEATNLEFKIGHLEKNGLNVNNLQENHKEVIKKILLKPEQRLKAKNIMYWLKK